MNAVPADYATDEDVAIRAPADFAGLCPRDQKLAAGADGLFALAQRWTLRSPSTAFLDQGVLPGQVVQLLKPTAQFRASGELFVAVTVEIDRVTLRRPGIAAGFGQPPAPTGGLVGVEFLILTLGPQLAAAGAELAGQLGLEDVPTGGMSPGLRASLREATVMAAIHRQYLDLGRGAGDSTDYYVSKARRVSSQLETVLLRIAEGLERTRLSERTRIGAAMRLAR